MGVGLWLVRFWGISAAALAGEEEGEGAKNSETTPPLRRLEAERGAPEGFDQRALPCPACRWSGSGACRPRRRDIQDAVRDRRNRIRRRTRLVDQRRARGQRRAEHVGDDRNGCSRGSPGRARGQQVRDAMTWFSTTVASSTAPAPFSIRRARLGHGSLVTPRSGRRLPISISHLRRRGGGRRRHRPFPAARRAARRRRAAATRARRSPPRWSAR